MRQVRSSQHRQPAGPRRVSAGLRAIILPVAAVAVIWSTFSIAEEMPSYTDASKATKKCEEDTPSRQAIRGCTDLEKSPATDAAARIRTYTMRGFAWLKDEAPQAAIADFSRVIEMDPENLAAYKGRAWGHERLYQYREALKDWTRLIELKSNDPELYRERAYTHHLDGQHERAVADFTRVLELDKENLDSRIGRALAYDALNKLPEALADFESALRNNAKYTAVYVARGELWERRGEHENAIADYKNALRLGATSRKVKGALKRLGALGGPKEKTQ